MRIEEAHSAFFGDSARFPPGSVAIDCALLMRNIEHEWHSRPDLYVAAKGESFTTDQGAALNAQPGRRARIREGDR